MSKVIEFKSKQQIEDDLVTQKMLDLADVIDDIIIENLDNGFTHREMAALLAHRLATLLKNYSDQTELLDLVEKIMNDRLKESS